MSYSLTSVQREFLKILNCFIHDRDCEVSEDFTAFDELYSMAAIHRVTAAVFEVICQDPRVARGSGQPDRLFSMWKRGAIREVSLQTQKTYQFLQLYKQMCELGLRPIVVKGIIRRQTYSKPDYCSSSDEDLLIPRVDFAKCDAFLLQQGFKRQPVEGAMPMEVSYYHPKTSVYLEVHMALFADQLGVYGNLNQDFVSAHETAIMEEIQGVPVWTLEPTLHMWYLICHSLKHFLHSGFGLRQICDIVKMAEYYNDRIDWGRIEGLIAGRKLWKYWGGILDIAYTYFEFSPETFLKNVDEKLDIRDFILNAIKKSDKIWKSYDGGALLLDLFDSGIYGSSSLARRQSSNMTLTAAKKGRKSTLASLWNSLFPGKEYMHSKYKYLKDRPWMLPKAWLSRFRGYLRAQKKALEKAGDASRKHKSINIGMKRVELLKKYGIIGEK